MSIKDIVELFSYYEDFVNTCSECGTKPKFFYRDTCTTESIIVLKCEHKSISRTISLIQLAQVSLPKLYITSVLAEMVNTWNEAQVES